MEILSASLHSFQISKANSHDLLWEFFNQFQSLNTRKGYQRDLADFANFLEGHFPEFRFQNILELKRSHFLSYRAFLSELDLAPKTIHRRLSTLSSFFDFLIEKGICEHNLVQGVKRPRQSVRHETQDLSDEQVESLFSYLEKSKETSPLHTSIIVLLFTTGIRKKELSSLKIKDVDFSKEAPKIKIVAKGGKNLVKILHPYAVSHLEAYRNWMKLKTRSWKNDDYFFRPSRNPKDPRSLDKELSPKTIDYILKKACRSCGIFERISPHSARATYIGSALENGADLYKVARDVGHQSVRTTEEYNKRRMRAQDSSIHHLGFLKKKES